MFRMEPLDYESLLQKKKEKKNFNLIESLDHKFK